MARGAGFARRPRRRFPSDEVFLCDEGGRASGLAPDVAARLERSGVLLGDLSRHPRLRALAEPTTSPSETEIALPGGIRIVARAVRPRGRDAGSVLVVRSPAAREPRDARPGPLAALLGDAPAFRETLRLATRAAASRESVLLTGESGTGKELVAKAIHAMSPRAAKPLVAVNCVALPLEIPESELFLDEIGELPLELQGKLLRVLDERTVFPLAGVRERPVDVRIIAATNRDLARAVSQGRSGSTSITASRCSRSRCRRSASVATTSSVSAGAFSRRRVLARAAPCRSSAARRRRRCAPIRGRGTCASSRTSRPISRSGPRGTRCGSSISRPDSAPRRSARSRPISSSAPVTACGGNRSEAARRLGVDRSTVYRRLKRAKRPRPRT